MILKFFNLYYIFGGLKPNENFSPWICLFLCFLSPAPSSSYFRSNASSPPCNFLFLTFHLQWHSFSLTSALVFLSSWNLCSYFSKAIFFFVEIFFVSVFAFYISFFSLYKLFWVLQTLILTSIFFNCNFNFYFSVINHCCLVLIHGFICFSLNASR